MGKEKIIWAAAGAAAALLGLVIPQAWQLLPVLLWVAVLYLAGRWRQSRLVGAVLVWLTLLTVAMWIGWWPVWLAGPVEWSLMAWSMVMGNSLVLWPGATGESAQLAQWLASYLLLGGAAFGAGFWLRGKKSQEKKQEEKNHE
ncbi:MAG: hypothetical protein ACOX7F_01695 [Eubacteriales bacterium]|jgi:hypothetical protein